MVARDMGGDTEAEYAIPDAQAPNHRWNSTIMPAKPTRDAFAHRRCSPDQ
jgi:hypothetical protein